MRPRRLPLFIACVGVAAIAAAVPKKPLSLVWNASPSVAVGLYRVSPATAPQVGELAVVRPSPSLARFMSDRRYVETGVPLVKPVAAVGGSRVCRQGTAITIDGRHVATALEADSFGRPLPGWTGCVRLGRDQLFLIAPASPASFDSRYFGPVAQEQVIGRAMPLWTRS